ncbi:PAS domain-containing protein [Naasia aerilata]|uniref:PAS domain S-box protein n=1 Tax=Naasia aerilata TaxID=1162966 RepID=A0ABN6XKR2_9MICO|nr:PAS domain-containing protein [Naasia aerilata]BDZ45547.1 hypothetical protein GCM10025866_14560 [Naasia aerilata]
MTAPEPAPLPSDDSFEELYEHGPVGQLSMTLEGAIIRVNATLLRWTGYTADQLRGARFPDLLDAGGRLFYETRFLPVLRLRGEAREVALSLETASGVRLPVIINSVLVTNQDGSPRLLRTAVLDATERQDYERQLVLARRSSEGTEGRLRVLQDASIEFARSGTEDSLTAALAAKARGALAAAGASVLLLDESGALRLAAGTDPLASAGEHRMLRPETEALSSGSVVTIASIADAAARYPELVDVLLEARVEALCVTPMLDEHGQPMGLVMCRLGRARSSTPPRSSCRRPWLSRGARSSRACACSGASSGWPCTTSSRDSPTASSSTSGWARRSRPRTAPGARLR